jgi:hypothetical protein
MGMSYRQIQSHLQEMYSVELSEAQLTNITGKILPIVEAWRNRPLEALYAIVWLNAICYKERHEGRIVNRVQFAEVRRQQTPEGIHARSQACLSGAKRISSPGPPWSTQGKMG